MNNNIKSTKEIIQQMIENGELPFALPTQF